MDELLGEIDEAVRCGRGRPREVMREVRRAVHNREYELALRGVNAAIVSSAFGSRQQGRLIGVAKQISARAGGGA